MTNGESNSENYSGTDLPPAVQIDTEYWVNAIAYAANLALEATLETRWNGIA